jgi:collagen type XVIII alpha
LVNNVCYGDGAAHPSATCTAYSVTCNAAASKTSWTVAGNGCAIGAVCQAPGAADPTGCSECNPTTSKLAWTPKGTCSNILLAALNEAHTGDLGGLAGADALCANQAAAAGYTGTWKAFISTSTQNLKDLITGTNASSMPVVNLQGENMWASWNAVFSNPSWNSSTSYIWTFNGNYVDEGRASPDWSDADGRHGSTAAGVAHTSTCNDFTSASSSVSGANGEWDFGDMFNSEVGLCSTYMAVACVRLP